MTLTLEERVTALEAAESLDTLAPTYLTVNPDGTIGAAFTGTVSANGLTLNTLPPAAALTAAQEIRWVRQADGAVVATEYVYDNPGGDEAMVTKVRCTAQGFSIGTSYSVEVDDDLGRGQAGIILQQANRGALGLVSVSAGGAGGGGADVIDQSGRSTFLQLVGARQKLQAQVFSAAVPASAAGGTVLQGLPSAFAAGHLYDFLTVTFAQGGTPMIACEPNGIGSCLISWPSATPALNVQILALGN